MPSTIQSGDQTNSVRTEESLPIYPSVENRGEISKYAIRKQVWTDFEKNGLVSFPRPVRGRIPNFHGAPQAAVKLAELDVFKKANCIKVNADKPQENVRILTLEMGKNLLVSAPRDKEFVLMKVIPKSLEIADLKKAASRRGMLEQGNPIQLGTDVKIDLLVVGSVVVSREGHRIGKGEGFGDLEYAILMETEVITKNTVVATTVHDSQVFETLPRGLFKDYDVPVDLIITPSEVIKIDNKLRKPNGIIWNLLSQRKLNLMAVLKVLREKEISNGKECNLKEDTDSETERIKRRFNNFRRFVSFTKKRSLAKSEGEKDGNSPSGGIMEKHVENKTQTRRLNRRFAKKVLEVSDVTGKPDLRKPKKIYQRRRRFPRSSPIQFSIRIGNINSNVRVRDLKNALAERNIKPTVITWRGHKGFAFIHFAKPKKESVTPNQADTIVASLRGMKFGNGEDGVSLLIEHTKPVIRIETTGVTAI